ncbi:CBF/Mak21 family-domain-containing protein [Lipomyces chichibuensis]|uniref:CBF/Mak21 family-domain-containing protein n=1 Tax=Lipomyces chichibuensis TaxID=1546026 RepID=UPI0033438316
MPSVVVGRTKRQRTATEYIMPKKKRTTDPRSSKDSQTPEPTPKSIIDLEQQISSSTEYYNNLVYLIEYLNSSDSQIALLAATSLFRSFARMLAAGLLNKPKSNAALAQETVTLWLRDRYKDFKSKLIFLLNDENAESALTSLTILVRLVKEESSHLAPTIGEYYFAKALFRRILSALLNQSDDELLLEFVETYVNKYDDLRYYFLHFSSLLANDAQTNLSDAQKATFTTNLLSALYAIDDFPTEDVHLNEFWVELPKKSKQPVTKLSAQKAAFQDSWLAVLRLPLTVDQYKYILQIMHNKIVPYMSKPQTLMDFLTDSYDAGGSTSLLALNALFSLMQKYNLDYPNFYTKLYALLDRNVMHVIYRSRFFRLLDLFLSSTHLPALLVASFIKRLSRLAISAPPSAIVIVIPFIYNLLKRHNSCNVLLQRTDEEIAEEFDRNDPFVANESDPMKSRALDSSLWELATLQSHYHPNVATLAKIMSEPFHKPAYNIEDFMDHSYNTMLDAEFTKNIRNPPAVEFDLPKTLFESGNVGEQAYLEGWDLR